MPQASPNLDHGVPEMRANRPDNLADTKVRHGQYDVDDAPKAMESAVNKYPLAGPVVIFDALHRIEGEQD